MAHFESPESILYKEASSAELSEALTGVEQKLYSEIVPENKEQAISIDSFSDLYDPALIERHKQQVAEREELHRSRDAASGVEVWKKRGELFEAIVNTQIAESDWMGPHAEVIVPSKYDDFFHGIDSIIQFEEEGRNSHLALAIDVTESQKALEKKLGLMRKSILNGRLGQVKYFISNNHRGELNEVPHVVIGADRKNINEIAALILRFKRLQNSVAEQRDKMGETETSMQTKKDLAKTRDALANHPMQMIVLKEIKAQIETYRAYAEKMGKAKVVEAYARVLPIIEEIMETKKDVAMSEAAEEDPVYKMVLAELEDFEKVR